MTERDYQKRFTKTIKKLSTAHIPAVAEDTGLGPRWLYKLRNQGAEDCIRRPGKPKLNKLYEYFYGDK